MSVRAGASVSDSSVWEAFGGASGQTIPNNVLPGMNHQRTPRCCQFNAEHYSITGFAPQRWSPRTGGQVCAVSFPRIKDQGCCGTAMLARRS